MKMLKTLSIAATLLALAGGVHHASAQTVEEIKQRGAVKIGVPIDFPPFGSLDTQGKPIGYDVDVANLLAESLGVKAELVPVTGPNRIPYLQSNQIEIIVSSMGVTPERAKQVAFSAPYAGIELSVYGDKNTAVAAPADLAGKSISVTRASTQDMAVTDVAPEGVNIQRFDDDSAAVQALLSGQTPLLGASTVIIAQIEKMAPGRFDIKFPMREMQQAIAIRPGNDELLAHIDAFLVKIKESGELSAISEKWVEAPLPGFVLGTQ